MLHPRDERSGTKGAQVSLNDLPSERDPILLNEQLADDGERAAVSDECEDAVGCIDRQRIDGDGARCGITWDRQPLRGQGYAIEHRDGRGSAVAWSDPRRKEDLVPDRV